LNLSNDIIQKSTLPKIKSSWSGIAFRFNDGVKINLEAYRDINVKEILVKEASTHVEVW
jgi:hypothetical protein